MLLGNLQKGAINLTGVAVDIENNNSGVPGYEWQLKINNSMMKTPFVVSEFYKYYFKIINFIDSKWKY